MHYSSYLFQAAVVEAALEDDLRRRQGYDDFDNLNLTREEDEDATSGKSKESTPGSSAPGSPSKRGASKSPGPSGKSPVKKPKKTAPKTKK